MSLLVAAIDFGTTFSGYAFSFLHEYKSDPCRISVIRWMAGAGSCVSLKTSTCVLFDPTQRFHSFGYEAEEKYLDLALDDKHHDWYFFRRFKMRLNNGLGLTRETLLEDDKGKTMKAMKIFSSAIGYLKDHMLTSCQKLVYDIQQSDIMWVLMIPAIWTSSSKEFMREAAVKAGICGDKLLLVPEPEAVFLYYMHKETRMHGTIGAGTKCMVLIAEDTEVEIAVYDVQHKGILRKLFSAYNCDWGGNNGDISFCSFLTDIVGEDIMKAYRLEFKYDFDEFLIALKDKKMTIHPDQSGKITFKIPMSLLETYLRMNPESNINTRISSLPKYIHKMTWMNDRLRIDAQLAKALFIESCSKIVYHLQELFLYPTLRDVSSILLAGSYAESPMLQFVLREAFENSHRRVFVPQEAKIASLNGAVIYGHKQNSS